MKTVCLRGAKGAIGTVIGAIPGTGGPIAAFLAYDYARRFSKRPADFGKGELSGVVAPKTANNAVTGGYSSVPQPLLVYQAAIKTKPGRKRSLSGIACWRQKTRLEFNAQNHPVPGDGGHQCCRHQRCSRRVG